MSRQSEDSRREMWRLEILGLQTMMVVGTAEEGALAQAALTKTRYQHKIGPDNNATNNNWDAGNPVQHLLNRLQQENLYLTSSKCQPPNRSNRRQPRLNNKKIHLTTASGVHPIQSVVSEAPMEVDPPNVISTLGKRNSEYSDTSSRQRRKL
jgi:hypothetical protein